MLFFSSFRSVCLSFVFSFFIEDSVSGLTIMFKTFFTFSFVVLSFFFRKKKKKKKRKNENIVPRKKSIQLCVCVCV